MNKELIDRAWACLPREFKEKVKKKYARCVEIDADDNSHLPAYAVKSAISRRALLEKLFGEHNLTSDADGDDEMLTVSRKQIDALKGEIFKAIMDAHDADDWQDAAHYILDVMPRSFTALFGSKCLSDEDAHEDNFAKSEPKPAEPKEDKHFDNILKDGYRDHNRLHIAAMAMQGILSNADRMKVYERIATELPCEELAVVVARNALRYADTLMAKAKKGE